MKKEDTYTDAQISLVSSLTKMSYKSIKSLDEVISLMVLSDLKDLENQKETVEIHLPFIGKILYRKKTHEALLILEDELKENIEAIMNGDKAPFISMLKKELKIEEV